jgi:hypothetical protein
LREKKELYNLLLREKKELYKLNRKANGNFGKPTVILESQR